MVGLSWDLSMLGIERTNSQPNMSGPCCPTHTHDRSRAVAPQVGLNGIDNGAIRFTGVRVPRDALLDRFATGAGGGRAWLALLACRSCSGDAGLAGDVPAKPPVHP